MNLSQSRVMDHVREVLAAIAPEADLDALDPAASMREELDLDSMDFLRLIQDLGARTGVEAPESDYAKLSTLGGLVAYFQERAA